MERLAEGLFAFGGVFTIGTFMMMIILTGFLAGLRKLGLFDGDPIDTVVPFSLGVAAFFWCFMALGGIIGIASEFH